MKQHLTTFLFAAAMIVTQAVAGQDKAATVTDMEALRAAVKTDKRAYVASVLNLTEDEAKKFWSLYDAYQRGVDLANRQRTRAVEILVGRDKALSDPYARDLSRDLLAADDTELKARRTLQNKLMRALPPKKAARYLQLEAKVRAVQAYDIAAAIPLVQ